MNQTTSVATANVRSAPSRRLRNPAIVRAQFDEWLREMDEGDDIDTERGERIRELIDRVGTQASVARAVGVQPRTVGRWVEGRGVAAQHRDELARVLGRSVSYVMYGEEDFPEEHVVLARLDRIEDKLNETLRLLKRLEAAALQEPPGELGPLLGGSPPKPPRPEQDDSTEEPDDLPDTGTT